MRVRAGVVFACFIAAVAGGVATRSWSSPAVKPQLGHMVFFKLKDRTDANRQKLAAACHKHLSGHDGTVYFSVGTIAEDVVEPTVSVRDFDVALHLVFASKEDEAGYIKHPRHLKFIEENKDLWASARVFDSYIVPEK